MEGTYLLPYLLWKAGYKVSQKKFRFSRILSNTLSFTCQKDNMEWALRGNRLSVPFQPPRPTDKLENFKGLQFSAGSGSPITLLAKPFMKPQRGEDSNPWYGERSKKRPLKRLRQHSQKPLLWACQM
jgi:hypothetical protein